MRKRVYVSSTFIDLKQHRRKLNDSLRQAGYELVAMEDYPAFDERPATKCIADVRSSDYYVGILAWRYGTIPADANDEQKSITHLEYDAADINGIPQFMFLLNPEAEWKPEFMDSMNGEADGGARISALRHAVSERHGVALFTSPDDLARLVLAAIRHAETQPSTDSQIDHSSAPWDYAAPPPVIAGSAPQIPSLVVGRREAIRDLKAQLMPAAQVRNDAELVQVLTAIRGWPGIGKTTIAALLAHDSDIKRHFSDGVLWISLGQSPNVFDGLHMWLRALGAYGREENRPRTADEASSRLAAVLSNQRRLLIVDDVWDATHAVPFKVGGPRSAMLITTRLPMVAQELASRSAAVYVLPVLSKNAALELFRYLIPAAVKEDQPSCEQLIDELDGLPLALQVAARLLAADAQVGLGVSTLLLELRATRKRLLAARAPANYPLLSETTPTVAALLDRSVLALEPMVRECYAYLGVVAPKPATFDLEFLRAQWNVGEPGPLVRILVDRGLLEGCGGGRFQMHALLVDHARALLG